MTKRTKKISAGSNPLFSRTLLLTNVVPHIRTTNNATKYGISKLKPSKSPLKGDLDPLPASLKGGEPVRGRKSPFKGDLEGLF